MNTDDQIKPVVEQKPPDLGDLAKNYLWEFLGRKFGQRAAVVIFLIIVSTLYFRSEIGQVVSDLHGHIVEWWPVPEG